jgi:hypothetical protein
MNTRGQSSLLENISVEGISLVGCTTFLLTASNYIMTFEALHNTCCENDSCSEYQALRELSYKYLNLVIHKDMLSLHP